MKLLHTLGGTRTLAAISLLSLVAVAQAAPIKINMTPGLWETQVTLEGEGAKQLAAIQGEQMSAAMAEMKKQLANMPPEQRKQMEAMMAQSGMSLSEDGASFKNDALAISKDGVTAKSCITQAEIDRGDFAESNEDCTSSIKQLQPNHFKSTQTCKDGDGSSEMDVIFDSPKHYIGTGKVTQLIKGNRQELPVKIEGTWLKTDCGDIKSEADKKAGK